MKTICVYCSSSNLINPLYAEVAQDLGREIARKQWATINGGGNRGLMKAVSDAAMEHGGQTVGIAPQFMVDEGWVAQNLNELIVVQTMHERKQLLADRSDAVIALPGGVGTFDELFEIITWKQLGLYHGPIVILNANGYYDKMLEMLDHATKEGFIGDFHQEIWHVATTPTLAIEYIASDPRWINNPRKGAALG